MLQRPLVALLAGATLALALGPLAASAPANCEKAMLRELGWEDVGATAALQPGPEAHACTGRIQPGAQLANLCTMNFLFRDGHGSLFFGTAGHCTGGPGEVLGVQGVGPAVATVVHDDCTPSSCPTDFALARIDPAFHGAVDPTLCHWGGPSGVNTDPQAGQTTHGYGFGNFYNVVSATRARVGAVVQATVTEVGYVGFAQPGDSGAPLVSGDGRALGVHVVSTVGLPGVRVDPSLKYATRLDAAMLRAEQATGLDLELMEGLAPFSLLGS